MVTRPRQLSLSGSRKDAVPNAKEPSTAEIMAELVNGLSPVLANVKLDTPAENAAQFSITALLADYSPSKLAPGTNYKEVNPFSNVFGQPQTEVTGVPSATVPQLVVENPTSDTFLPDVSAQPSWPNDRLSPHSPEMYSSSSEDCHTDSSLANARSRAQAGRSPGSEPRRKRCTQKLSPMEKKERRMQQNRTAAARCRQKKQESMGRMMQTFEQLAEENQMLKTSLRTLEQEIAEMRRMMSSHTGSCAHKH